MASQFSGSITVDGSGGSAQNFGTLLAAAGYTGTFALKSYKIKNASTTVTLRVIETASNVAPSSPSSKGVTVLDDTIQDSSGNNDPIMDAGTTWLYTASSISIEVMVVGGGV